MTQETTPRPQPKGIRRLGLILALLALSLGSFGCSSMRIGDLSVISSRNVNLDKVDLDTLEGTRVTGKDGVLLLLGLIPLGGLPNLEEAMDDALNQGGGDLMLDAVVRSTSWSAIIVAEVAIEVEGEVVKTRGAK